MARQTIGRWWLASGCALWALGCAAAAPSAAPAPTATAAPAPSGATAGATYEIKLVENFDGAAPMAGGWGPEFDKNGLGTDFHPDPLELDKSGSDESPKGSLHLWGRLGANQAPWSWAGTNLFLSQGNKPTDISQYQSVTFNARGDGGRYALKIVKSVVNDGDHYKYEFNAPAHWTKIKIPLAAFSQAGWGKKVPKEWNDVVALQFAASVFDHKFDVAVDDVTLSKEPVSLEPIAYDTRGWFEYRGTDPAKRKGTALDVSRVLDAPAGKHGHVVAKGADLGFEDGKPARFFGVNIVASANFPTHEQADKIADLLAQMGVSLTRHHHIDASWSTPNVFGNKDSTLALDKAAMDRFDYFVAALQKRGIYQFFDMLVHRTLTAKDGVKETKDVTAGFKIEGEFDPKLISLEEQFVRQLLGHTNPYLKQTYAASPGLAMMEIINEDSLFYLQKVGDFSITTPYYEKEFQDLFNAWLKKNFKTRAALEARWKPESADKKGLAADEDPAKNAVKFGMSFIDGSYKQFSRARAADSFKFLYETQKAYHERMAKVIRAAGYKGLLTGSNHWVSSPIDVFENAQLGFVDRHSYWGHPSGGYGYAGVSFEPSAMVSDENLGVVSGLADRRAKGVPYSISEWQASAPNDYRHEGTLLMAAVASLQGYNPIQFAFSHGPLDPEAANQLDSNFDLVHQPTMLGSWSAASLMFHRGDVAPAEGEAYRKMGEADALDPEAHLEVPGALAGVVKTGLDLSGGGKTPAELQALLAELAPNGATRTKNGQVMHDPKKGLFVVNTARTQGFAGFKQPGGVDLGNAHVDIDNAFAVVIVSSLDDAPIQDSKHLLVTTLGNAINTGMTLETNRGKLANVGSAPILVEPITGSVLLKTSNAAKLSAFALDPNGQHTASVVLSSKDGGVVLPLAAASKAMFYELVTTTKVAP